MSSQNHNLLLKEKFSALTSLQKEKLVNTFRNASLMLRLINFLEEARDEAFQSHHCIQKVYGVSLNDADYATIENRFFKLRKKLLDALAESDDATERTHFSDEELELRECIDLLNKGQKDLAYSRLQELETHCWKKNLFELLPRIIDRLIFCNQSFNRIVQNKAIYKRYDEAVRLNTLVLQVVKKVRQVYEINFSKGIAAAKSEMRFIKKAADANKKYPRFSFIYHHLSLYYKLGSPEYVDKMQVLGKHHAAIKKIYREHGNLAIIYTPNHEYLQEVHLKEISMFYLYNKCDFEAAYKESCELKKFTANNSAPRAESFFYNAFRAELAAERYSEAKQTLDEYMDMLRKNNQTDRFPFVHMLQMMLYVFGYPRVKLENPAYTEKMFDQYIRWAQKNENLIAPYEESLLIKAGYNHIRKKYSANLQLLSDDTLKNYFEQKELYMLFQDLTRHFSTEANDAKVPSMFQARIDQLRFKVRTPNSHLFLQRLQRFIQ